MSRSTIASWSDADYRCHRVRLRDSGALISNLISQKERHLLRGLRNHSSARTACSSMLVAHQSIDFEAAWHPLLSLSGRRCGGGLRQTGAVRVRSLEPTINQRRFHSFSFLPLSRLTRRTSTHSAHVVIPHIYQAATKGDSWALFCGIEIRGLVEPGSERETIFGINIRSFPLDEISKRLHK